MFVLSTNFKFSVADEYCIMLSSLIKCIAAPSKLKFHFSITTHLSFEKLLNCSTKRTYPRCQLFLTLKQKRYKVKFVSRLHKTLSRISEGWIFIL